MIGGVRKRIYKRVAVRSEADGYGIILDGKPARTPRRQALTLPTRRLAEAVAAEWEAQGPELDPMAMPLTRLAGSAIDIVAFNRAEVVERTAAYGGTDLLCYRADRPAELARRQSEAWQPVVDWAIRRYDAPLEVTSGVIAVAQPARALDALVRAVESYDDMRLAAVSAATAACGSLLLALALAEGRIDPAAAWALSQLDETFQIEQWGEDSEARKSRESLRNDIEAAGRFLELVAG